MQTAAWAFSPCTPLLKAKHHPLASSPNPNLRLRSFAVASRARIHGLSIPRLSLSSRPCSWISDPAPVCSDQREGVVVRATSVPESAGESPEKSSALLQTLQLGSLFGLWYLFNIYFNIYNKQDFGSINSWNSVNQF